MRRAGAGGAVAEVLNIPMEQGRRYLKESDGRPVTHPRYIEPYDQSAGLLLGGRASKPCAWLSWVVISLSLDVDTVTLSPTAKNEPL